MKTFLIEIHPKSPKLDPVAKHLQIELEEAGESPKTSTVTTCRLFKIEGELSAEEVQKIADTLLVDRVIEKATIEAPNNPKAGDAKTKEKKVQAKPGTKSAGFVLDIWPKQGVTDPVGETVEKGIHDLGIRGAVKTSSALRYFFPKMIDKSRVRSIARRLLSNELIHDIDIRNTDDLN